MKITYQEKGTIKGIVEDLDDLWYLSQIISQNDLLGAKTTRKVKIGDKETAVKKTYFLSVNVKKIEFGTGTNDAKVRFDLNMTAELEAEGYMRELVRRVQAERKKIGLKKGELIKLEIGSEKPLAEMIKSHTEFIRERTNSEKVDFVDLDCADDKIEFEIKKKKFFIKIS